MGFLGSLKQLFSSQKEEMIESVAFEELEDFLLQSSSLQEHFGKEDEFIHEIREEL